jgi:hypothetical protein
MGDLSCDILIVGGGLGGCAAALAASSMGFKVVLTEQYSVLGGQLVSQAVPPDEHPWIESFGCTARYRELRNRVRDHFQQRPGLLEEAKINPFVNPGRGWVSRVCAEPLTWLTALEEMLSGPKAAGLIDVRLGWQPTGCDVWNDRIESVTLLDLESGAEVAVRARMVLDATETGELLPLSGAEYVVGAESRHETGEPHAPVIADPDDVQGFTWCLALGWDPLGDHTIEQPQDYGHWKTYRPEGWPGPMLGLDFPDVRTGSPRRLEVMDGELSLFAYRRVVDSGQFDSAIACQSATIVNWPQNDYFAKGILDRSDEDVAEALRESQQLSLSLLYWLQTDLGLKGLCPRPDITGAPKGLAVAPYIRESRRIRAVTTLTELELGADANLGLLKARERDDSIGIGAYRIDLHPSPVRGYLDLSSLPFQIPFGSLIPVRLRNLLPACKNIGVTHIASGCTRLHPVEWNVGEAAGLLAGFSLACGCDPAVASISEFQTLLLAQGVELSWPEGIWPL